MEHAASPVRETAARNAARTLPARILLAFALLNLGAALPVLAGPRAGDSMGLIPGRSIAAPHRTDGTACGIFVAKTGINDATCGLTSGTPCFTVQQGIDRAVAEGASCVFVQAGVYTQTITLAPGVSVIGGFDASWVRGPYTLAGHASEIRGVTNQVDSQSMAVAARSLTSAVLLEDLILVAPNASGLMTGTSSGKSSYAIHASGSNLVVRNCKLVAGSGVAGVGGANGRDALSIARNTAMNGTAGGNGDQFLTACNATSRGAAGPAGANSSCTSANGGGGGAGGTMDTDCSGVINQLAARSGIAGQDATTVVSLFGTKGAGGATCSDGGMGLQGRIQNGAAGTPGVGNLSAVGAPQFFVGATGSLGGLGLNGGGGGGGGGEGGCDTGVDSYGAGGGGGGAGGCLAAGGGSGGGAGGGSFGLALLGSHVDMSGCEIVFGQGGKGGAGGTGGRGQQGGLAGPGGISPNSHQGGGSGGVGGHGGHAGGGAGGAGGASIGIARCSNSTATVATTTFSGSAPGAGGAGGISAPGAQGGPDDDGNDGQAGPTGTSAQNQSVATCATGGLPNLAITPCDIATCLLVDVPGGDVSEALSFAGLRPNPTSAGGHFQFALPRAGRVRLALYDPAGRHLRTVVDAEFGAGAHVVVWDGLASAGRRLGSGIYLAKLEFDSESRMERVLVIR